MGRSNRRQERHEDDHRDQRDRDIRIKGRFQRECMDDRHEHHAHSRVVAKIGQDHTTDESQQGKGAFTAAAQDRIEQVIEELRHPCALGAQRTRHIQRRHDQKDDAPLDLRRSLLEGQKRPSFHPNAHHQRDDQDHCPAGAQSVQKDRQSPSLGQDAGHEHQ